MLRRTSLREDHGETEKPSYPSPTMSRMGVVLSRGALCQWFKKWVRIWLINNRNCFHTSDYWASRIISYSGKDFLCMTDCQVICTLDPKNPKNGFQPILAVLTLRLNSARVHWVGWPECLSMADKRLALLVKFMWLVLDSTFFPDTHDRFSKQREWLAQVWAMRSKTGIYFSSHLMSE